MLLSLITFLPLVFALCLLVLPGSQEKLIRIFSLIFSLGVFGVSIFMLTKFHKTAELQFVERVPWVPELGISYFLGIDGISLWLVILTTFLTPVIILGSWSAISTK